MPICMRDMELVWFVCVSFVSLFYQTKDRMDWKIFHLIAVEFCFINDSY